MIFVECKADFTLIKSITNISEKQIIHPEGANKFEVCKSLEKHNNCIGLVDEDPSTSQPSSQLPYSKKMKIEKDLTIYGIKRLYDEEKNNYLVILSPKLEDWILNTVKEENIEIQKYNLPNDPDKLHDITDFKKFEILLSDLKNSKRMKILKEVIEK